MCANQGQPARSDQHKGGLAPSPQFHRPQQIRNTFEIVLQQTIKE